MLENKKKVHWEPNPGPQTECLELEEVDEKLFGGGRGGGKSDAGMVWLINPTYLLNPKFRGLVIRRNSTDLSDWVDRARWMYSPTGAKFSGNPTEIHFPTGAVIRTGHLKDEGAYTKYQGHEYQRMLIEELTHIPSEDLYEKLIASCRSTIQGLPPRILCTTNPDGNGRQWVKKRFITIGAPGTVWRDPNTQRTRVYIASTVKDNPYLMQDKNYVQNLQAISDPDLRKAWLEGDWDSFSVKGAVYVDLLNEAKREGRITRVAYDRFLPVDTFWDLGYDDATCILFVQTLGGEKRIIDCYEATGLDIMHYVRVLKDRGYVYGTHWVPHDSKARSLTTGRSILEILMNVLPLDDIRVVPRIGGRERGELLEGINATRMLFPALWIDDRKCRRLVECFEQYHREWDEELLVYRPKPQHDWSSHMMDAIRYMAVVSRITGEELGSKKVRERAILGETSDPFDVRDSDDLIGY